MARPSRVARSNPGTVMPMGHREAPFLGLTRPPPGIFCRSYQCHSMACLDRPGLEFGDKIIMPQAAFREAHRLRLKLPLLFKLVNTSESTRRITGTGGTAPCQFCGVLEFSAPDDQVFLPYWLMQNLLLAEGTRIELRSLLRPPAGSFVRFKPHNDSFLDVAARQGPKVLMEEALRLYSVLCEGATILVQHEGENFYLDVMEVRTFAPLPATTSSDSTNNNDRDEASSHLPARIPCLGGIETDSENCGHLESRENSNKGTGNAAANDDTEGFDDNALPPSAGRRVRLVSLLGDLDLEVEFCAPHSALAPSSPQHDATEQQCARRGHITNEVAAHEHSDVDGGHGRASNRRNPRSGIQVSTGGASPSYTPVMSSLSSSSLFAGSSSCRSASNTADITGDGSPSEITEVGSNCRISSRGQAVSLPAPAKARKSCGDGHPTALLGSGSEPASSRAGIKPPAPPVWKASSKTSKCQAFSGRGVSLLESMTLPDLALGDRARIGTCDATAEGDLQCRQELASRTAAVPAAPAAKEKQKNAPGIIVAGGVGNPIRDRIPGKASCGETIGGQAEQMAEVGSSNSGGRFLARAVDENFMGKGQVSPNTKRVEGGMRGRALEEGISGAGSLTAAAATAATGSRLSTTNCLLTAMVTEDQRPSGDKTGGTATAAAEPETRAVAVPCGFCGKLVPAANQVLHELRCGSSAVARPGRRSSAPRGPSEGVDRLQHPPSEPSPGTYPARANKPSTAAREITPAGTAVAEQERTTPTPPPPTTTTKLGVSSVPASCAYCGLSFRTAGAAGEHELACAARTERCDRCCGLVSRRESESHRRAGGGCDAAIARAKAAEAQGSEAVGGGSGGRGSRTGGIAEGGRFDALLAEAVRSSKAASAVLADTREKNDVRLAKVASERREDAPIRSCLGSGRDDGGDRGSGTRSCSARAGNSGKRRVSTSGTGQLQLPSPVCRAGVTETCARGERPGQVSDVKESSDCHDGGRTEFDASRVGKSNLEGRSSLFSRLLEKTAGCAAPTNTDRSDPRNGASAPEETTEEYNGSSVLPPAESGKSCPLDRRAPCRSSREKAGHVGGAATNDLEGSPWSCSRCTLTSPYGSEVCDACGSTRRSDASIVEGNGGGRKREEAQDSDNCRPSYSGHEMPAPIAAGLADHEHHDVDPTVRTGAGREESDRDAGVVTAFAARVAGSSSQSPRQSSTKLHALSTAAELRALSTAAVVPNDESPSPSSGTLGSIVAAIGRNMDGRPGALLPALASVARGDSLPSRSDRNASTSGQSTLIGGESDAAEGSRLGDGQGLRRPSVPQRTPTSGRVSVPQRQQRRQQYTSAVNLERIETDRRPREHRRRLDRRRDGRRTPPTTKIIVGPPRRLGGAHRPRQSRYPASSLLTPSDEPLPSTRSASAATPAVFVPPSIVSAHVPIVAANASQGTPVSRHHPQVRHARNGFRLSSSSAPSGGPAVQGSFKHSGGKHGLTSGDRSGSGGRRGPDSSSGGGGGDGSRHNLPEAAPPPSHVAPVCDISLSILGRSQGPEKRDQRVNRLHGKGRISSPVRPRYEIGAFEAPRWRQGSGRDDDGGDGGGISGRGDPRGWDGHDGADGRVGSGVAVVPAKLRRRVSVIRLLEPLNGT